MKDLIDYIYENSQFGILDFIKNEEIANIIKEREDRLWLDNVSFDNENMRFDSYYTTIVNSINEAKLSKNEIASLKNTLINETLKSYSANDFIKAIKKKLPEYNIDSIEPVNKIDDLNNTIAFRCMLDIDIDNFDKLLEICKFYRYYITKGYVDFWMFEPFDTIEVTKEIKFKYGNKIYHLTDTNLVDDILKHGFKVASMTNDDNILYVDYGDMFQNMKVKNAKTIRDKIRNFINYRLFHKRTFFCYSNKNPREIFYDIKQIKGNGDYSLIEVDLKSHNIPLFKDSMMTDSEYFHYTYSIIDIPKSLIKNVYKF